MPMIFYCILQIPTFPFPSIVKEFGEFSIVSNFKVNLFSPINFGLCEIKFCILMAAKGH